MLTFLSLMRSKVAQLMALLSVTLMLLLAARSSTRKDAVEEAYRELESADEAHAKAIRERVDRVPIRVREPPLTDTRGYRD